METLDECGTWECFCQDIHIHWHPSVQQSALLPAIRSVWPRISRHSLTPRPSPCSPLLRFPLSCCHVCWPTAAAYQWLSPLVGSLSRLPPPRYSPVTPATSSFPTPILTLLLNGYSLWRKLRDKKSSFCGGRSQMCVSLYKMHGTM